MTDQTDEAVHEPGMGPLGVIVPNGKEEDQKAAELEEEDRKVARAKAQAEVYQSLYSNAAPSFPYPDIPPPNISAPSTIPETAPEVRPMKNFELSDELKASIAKAIASAARK